MSTPRDPNRCWAALLRTPGLTLPLLRTALAAAGSVEALLGATARELAALGFAPASRAALADPDEAALDADIGWLERAGARLLPFTSTDYPPLLATLDDAPVALYLRGNAALLSRPQVAIVGSRAPTAAGRRFALQLARDLSAAGLTITSGLARGIDTAAHLGALEGGAGTIAVCGTGLARCYPAANQALAERIAAAGVLASEFPPGADPRGWHFPRRNRIIAGLASGTVVVEAAADSGSLITARFALDAGREVFAVPGSPLNPLAAGCLELLLEGAQLARGAADVLSQIRLPASNFPFINHGSKELQREAGGGARLDKEYEMLLDALGFEPASIDDLVERTGLAPGSVASMILILELTGRVEQRPGALFNRID